MTVTLLKSGFTSGELSPSIWGRIDTAALQAGCSVMRNCFVSHRGPASSRAGTRFAGHSPTPAGPGTLPCILVHFQFNIFQSYELEFGARPLTLPIEFFSVTQPDGSLGYAFGNPTASINAPLNLSVGQIVTPSGFGGTAGIDGRQFVITSIETTSIPFLASIANVDGSPVVLPGPTANDIGTVTIAGSSAPYMRVIFDGAYVTENPIAATAATNTNPLTITAPGNNYAVGDEVFASGFAGMTDVNSRSFLVTAAGDTLSLADTFGDPIDATSFGVYAGGGSLARVYETHDAPYLLKDLPYLKFTQSADVLTLTCVNQEDGTEYPAADLSRHGITDWVYQVTDFGAKIAAPAACHVVPTTVVPDADTTNQGFVPAAAYGYCVTAVDAQGEESVASPYAFTPIAPISQVSVDIDLTAGSEIITWTAVNGAISYNVYKAPPSVWNAGPGNSIPGTPVPIGSSFGYIGTSFGTQFVDSNIVADMTVTPPLHNNPFARGQIQFVQPTAPGSGYTQGNTFVTIATSTGTGAVILPVVDAPIPTTVPGGIVNGINLTASGSGYSADTTAQVVSATGSGAVLQPAIVGNGAINGVTIVDGGTGYAMGDTVVFTDPAGTGSGAVATLTVSGAIQGGGVTGYIVQNGGQGYQDGDQLVVTGDGSGAAGTLQVGPQTGTYPGVCGYFQSRRVYAATLNRPDTLFFTQTDNYQNMDAATPPIDSDAIVMTPWGQQVNTIQWLVPGGGGSVSVGSTLLACTGLDVWQISGYSGGPLTPNSEAAAPQEANGFSPTVPPIRVYYNVLFVQELGFTVRDLQFNFFVNVYSGTDLSIPSNHLFEGYQLNSWAWAKLPWLTVWAVRNDGKLLSLTYQKEQQPFGAAGIQLAGWARHDTNGLFMRTSVSTEPPVDAPYFVVQRYVPGKGWAYYIERMDNHIWNNPEETWCVDCGLELAQTKPDAALSASAADGPGTISGGFLANGGERYHAPTAFAFDPQGTGSGFAMTLRVHEGEIKGFKITNPGRNYSPATEIRIADTYGHGARFRPIIDQNVTLTATAAVFAAAAPGDVVRIGGGQATVTSVVSATQVAAAITVPIVKTIAGDPNRLPVPAASGDWSITTPVTAIAGLDHLEGMTVTGIADGEVIDPVTVVKGAITLGKPASAVRVGLPFTAQLQALHIEEQSQGSIQGKRKRISGLTVRMEQTRGIQVGANQPVASALDFQQEVPWKNLVDVPDMANINVPQAAMPLFTGDRFVPLDDDWQNWQGNEAAPGMIAVQQKLPLPMSINALVPTFSVGDTPG